MSGSVAGGLKSRDKNLQRDPDWYRRIGKMGGSTPTNLPKGFAADRERARTAGAKGGTISKIGYRYVNGEYIKKEA